MTTVQSLMIRNGLEAALKICERPLGKSLLDIGSGQTDHNVLFSQFYSQAFTNDFLDSDDPKHIKGDILEVPIERKFDVVYASNILEHQKDVGRFLKRCVSLCDDDGYLVIIVPHQHHHKLLFGHLTSWTVGLLVYNLILAGIDCADAQICRGRFEISIIVRNRSTLLVGDIGRSAAIGLVWEMEHLKPYFPFDVFQGCSADMESINWPETYTLNCSEPMTIRTINDESVVIAPNQPFEVAQAKAVEPWWY